MGLNSPMTIDNVTRGTLAVIGIQKGPTRFILDQALSTPISVQFAFWITFSGAYPRRILGSILSFM